MAISPLQLPSATLNVPQIDWTPLSQLGEVYRTAQNRQKLSDLGRGIADGSVDYRQAAQQVADMGSSDAMFKFLTLAEAKDKQKLEQSAATDFSKFLGGLVGGQPAASPAAAPSTFSQNPVPQQAVPAVGAPQPAGIRAPVQPTAKVWGDDEAVAAGIYDPPPARPGAVAQSQPQGQQPFSLAALGNGGAMPMPSPSGPSQTTSGMAGQGPQVVPQRVAQAGPGVVSAGGQSALQATGGGLNLNISHLPQLAAFYANPNTPTAQRELAGKFVTRILDDAKPDEKVRSLQAMAAASGIKATPFEMEMMLRRAGKTDVNTVIDQKTESEENKAAGKAAGERRAAMFASAGSASKTLQNLSRMEGLLDQVSQGKLSPATMNISSWAKAFGVNDDVATSLGLDPKGVGSAQAIQSLINESVVGKIGPGGFPANNFSDADRSFITDIFPKLSNDPRGNKIMIEGARRMAQLDLQRAREFQAWKKTPDNKGRGFEDFEVEFSDKVSKQDMFGDLRKQAEAIVGAPRTDIGGTLSNPGSAPQQGRPQSLAPVQGGWLDMGGGVRIRERR